MSEMAWVTAKARERVEHMIEDLNRAKVLFDHPDEFDTYQSRLKNVYMAVVLQLSDEKLRVKIQKDLAKIRARELKEQIRPDC